MIARKVLVISPHSDDETFGMGATIAKLAENGDHVYCLLMCAGDKFEFEHSGKSVPQAVRIEEFSRACEILGARPIVDHVFEQETEMDTLSIKTIVGRIEEVQDRHGFSTWYIMGPSFNQDHRVVFTAAITAARPTRRSVPKEIYKYELPTYSWNPREWTMKMNVFECVDEFIDIKLSAVESYVSQYRDAGNKLHVDGIRQHAAIRGFDVGCKYAEAFEVVRLIR